MSLCPLLINSTDACSVQFHQIGEGGIGVFCRHYYSRAVNKCLCVLFRLILQTRSVQFSSLRAVKVGEGDLADIFQGSQHLFLYRE